MAVIQEAHNFATRLVSIALIQEANFHERVLLPITNLVITCRFAGGVPLTYSTDQYRRIVGSNVVNPPCRWIVTFNRQIFDASYVSYRGAPSENSDATPTKSYPSLTNSSLTHLIQNRINTNNHLYTLGDPICSESTHSRPLPSSTYLKHQQFPPAWLLIYAEVTGNTEMIMT